MNTRNYPLALLILSPVLCGTEDFGCPEFWGWLDNPAVTDLKETDPSLPTPVFISAVRRTVKEDPEGSGCARGIDCKGQPYLEITLDNLPSPLMVSHDYPADLALSQEQAERGCNLTSAKGGGQVDPETGYVKFRIGIGGQERQGWTCFQGLTAEGYRTPPAMVFMRDVFIDESE